MAGIHSLFKNMTQQKIVYPFIFTLILLLVCSQNLYAFTLELTEEELQEKIESKFPLEKKGILLKVILKDPKSYLETDSNKLNLTISVIAGASEKVGAPGTLQVRGRLEYRPESASIFFTEPEVLSIKIADLSVPKTTYTYSIISGLIEKRLANKAVYRFPEDTLKGKLVRSTLKQIYVKDKTLILEFALW